MKMIQKSLSLVTLVASVFSVGAQAFKGSISFDGATQARHYQTLNTIMDVASDCIEKDFALHQSFYKRYGVSAFYGSNTPYARMGRSGRMDVLRRLGKPVELVDQIKVTSCVGMTTKCLERGFNAAGQGDIWARVKSFVAQNDYDGTTLQHALQQLGWKVLYWNPDPSANSSWDSAERGTKARGNHAYFYGQVVNRGSYYGVKVDDAETLVGFGTRQPRKFGNVPFFVGTAHAGYHVFPGINGVVIEGHSMKPITDPNTIESAEFNPIKSGGAPRGAYRSGIIAVPPGYGF